VHPAAVYQEFDVEDENVSASTGLLRRWDFSQLETRFQTETGRNEIAGRERKVIAYLNDRNPNIGAMILQPKVDDGEHSVGYWEVFETRRRMKRLADFRRHGGPASREARTTGTRPPVLGESESHSRSGYGALGHRLP